ncbi:MAG: homogentisate 1,2-dioxygenase, partial [Betaproteobacteria bacterium]|nr:homogentisate 1,2-dioxygenase [Betaproteobacteria bacterium]
MAHAYMGGFGNQFATEALTGALPQGRNSPQRPAYGLYPEQLSGSSFTAPRESNLRSWMYRLLPSVRHGAYRPWDAPPALGSPVHWPVSPQQARWDAPPMPQAPCHWLASLKRMALNGSAASREGASLYVFACNAAMQDRFFQSADGEWLIIPQE